MDVRTLGRTGLCCGVIGLGTVKLGRTRGLKYPVVGTGGAGTESLILPSDEQAMDLLQAAAESGVSFIDTAPAYGVSEERLGSLMTTAGWFGGRERWIVSTKVGEEFDDASATSRFDFSPRAVRASVERSLRRLRVEVLDIVLLHSDGRDEWVLQESGGLDELQRLQKQGVIRAVGASTKSASGGALAVEMCDIVMLTLNPSARDDEPAIDRAADLGVGVLIKKALGSGHIDPAQAGASLTYSARRRGVGCVVVGTSSAARLRANVAAVVGSSTNP